MAKSKSATTLKMPSRMESHRTEEIPLVDIASNTAQSRGMGVLSNLQEMGYNLFEETEKGPAVWPTLLSDNQQNVLDMIALLEEHEPELVQTANSIHMYGQLEPIGVRMLEEGVDVIYGMRRAVACALNRARFPEDQDYVEAKVFDQDLDPIQLKLVSLEENSPQARREESPIDRAMTYQWLKKTAKMTEKQIGERVGLSDQMIKKYLKLLDDKIKDKRHDIHTLKLGIDKAVKLLEKRQGKEDAEPSEGGNGARFPNAKKLVSIYEAGYKPKKMDAEEWYLWTSEDVRKLLALKLGLTYTEFVAVDPPAEEEKKPAGKKLRVSRKRAIRLLQELGKTNANTWSNELLGDKLSSMPNQINEGQKVENPSLQKLLDKLLEGFAEGLVVEVFEEKDE
jgi:ParB/RepB/Spo0J family partition protein